MSENTSMENQQMLYSSAAYPAKESTEYALLARAINREAAMGKTVIGVFWDKCFEGQETPQDLEYKHFLETWGKNPDVYIVPLDANQVRSYSIISEAQVDILVFPYGAAYPMDAINTYSGESFRHFIKKGGSVLTTGGIPFMKQAGNNGAIMSLDTPNDILSVFDRWTSKFGIKFYPAAPTEIQQVNKDFLPSLDGSRISPSRYGIVVNNSSHEPLPSPPAGNVFPERYPARQIIPLMWGTDRYGRHIATTGILSQDYESGSTRIHFSYEGNEHPLSPHSPEFAQVMSELLSLLANKVYAGELECEYACYRQGEHVNIRSQIQSFERKPVDIQLHLRIQSAGHTLYESEKSVQIAEGSHCFDWQFAPENFEFDEYTVELTVMRDGVTVSRAENGFVVWMDETVRRAASLSLENQYFQFGGKGRLITGTNYYESTRGEIMWFRPNVIHIMRDFRQMAECGVNMIRPHYHHLKWFYDYLLYHHGTLFPFFEELEHINGYLPDEKRWRIFDLFIYLCHKHGIVYNGDLFTLVPSEMGDPRGWFGTTETELDYSKRPAQQEFMAALEQRYQNLPLIAWDLFNEPFMVADEDVEKWASALRPRIREISPERLMCVGGPFSLNDTLDFDCPHGRLAEGFINKKGKPLLVQELHIDKPELLEHEIQQGEDLRRDVVSTIRSGAAGVMPWSWTRQMRLWQDGTYMEKWDDRLGMHTHDDGTLKIAGRIFRDIAVLLRNINVVSYDCDKQCTVTDKGLLSASFGSERYKGNSIYHCGSGKLFAAMDMSSIKLDGRILLSSDKETYLYFYAEESAFDDAETIYVKTEAAGKLKVMRGGAKSVELVDFTHEGVNILDMVRFEQGDEFTEITVEPVMIHYWLRYTY